MRTLTGLACTALVVGFVAGAGATTWYVPSQCPNIQAGIDSAATGDTVVVADGTYTGAGNKNIDFLGKGILVTSENGPELTVIDCQGSGLGFYFTDGEDSTSVLRGLTIQNGGMVDEAAGIYCYASSPTIEGNTIRGGSVSNEGGGILCTAGSSPIIVGNTITGNLVYTAGGRGGGISCSGSSPTITGNTITANRITPWGPGAGIYCYESSPTIIGNTIEADSTYGLGGGISCERSSPWIEGNTIMDCLGGDSGGGIACIDNSSPTIVNNTITGNAGDYAGGIYCRDSSPIIRGNTVADNEAWSGCVGIVCMNYSSPTITGNTITGNQSDYGGGGILCDNYSSPMILDNAITENVSAWANGGGIECNSHSAPILISNTIAGNVAGGDGGGIYCDVGCTLTVTNSILWGDGATTGQEVCLSNASVISFAYCDVEGGTLGVYVAPGCSLHIGPGNIDEDPLFVSGWLGDYYLSQIAAGQGEESPCVDAANPASLVPVGRTTRTDGYPDIWPLDIGYHYPTNRGPDLVDQPDTATAENQYLTFTLEASDPDEDSIAFSSPDLPSGATLDAVTGVFEWTPTYQQAGLYTVTFIATDYGTPALADTEQTDITVTDVVEVENGDEELMIPLTRYLSQNCPNPFRLVTTIEYGFVAPTHVSLKIYDIRGALVRRLVDEQLAAGHHRASWDGRDSRGHRVGSGIYFCRLEAADFTETRRMVVLR